jgi:GAF domain-containing protein
MSVICLGRACLEEIMPFLDSLSEEKDILMPDRPLTPTRNMELIGKVSDVLKQSKDINEILEKILDSILSLLTRIDRGVIILFDDNTGNISNVITRTKERHDTTLRLYSRSIVNRVRQEGKAFIMRDTKSESDVDMSKSMKLMNVRSVMCVPLVSKSRVRGVIYVDSINKPHGFRNDDLSLLKALSSPAAMAIENATIYARGGQGLIQ